MRSAIERFEEKINKTEDCWFWMGAKAKGYGQMFMNGKVVYAHRFSYEIHHGKIPEGLCVLHECDTPLCVNPKHLFLGTNQENTKDRVIKSRCARGEKQGHSKLTDDNVLEIKTRLNDGESHRYIARLYSVSHNTIGRISRGQQWTHI